MVNKSVSEGVITTSFGAGRGVSVRGGNLKLPQTGGGPGDFSTRQDKTTETSPNSGESPGKKLTCPAINNQQLACTPQGGNITEESLRFERAMEALGESTYHTKDEVFAKEISAYGRPRHGANICPTHLDSAPPPVAVGKGTTDWLSKPAVRYAPDLLNHYAYTA